MDFSDFDLEKTANLNYMGLTATVAGEKGLICGWDGSEYTVETENGRRLKTADYVWEYDNLADEDVMEQNAKTAALLSPESPYRDNLGRLSFDATTGEWQVEQRQAGTTDPLSQIQELLRMYDEGQDDEDIMSHPAMQAFPALLVAATREDLDASDVPEVQRYMKHRTDPSEGHDSTYTASLIKHSILPILLPIAADVLAGGAAGTEAGMALGAGAEGGAALGGASGSGGMIAGLTGALSKIPGASRAGGLVNSGLKMMGLQSLTGPLLGGGQQQQSPIQVQRPTEFGYTNARVNEPGDARDHFGISREAAPKTDGGLIQAMQAKVVGILNSIGGKTDNVRFDPNAMWFVLMDAALKATDVAVLQSIIQCIPPELHNADPSVPEIEQTTPPLTLPSPNPGGSAPKIPGASPGPEPGGPAAPALGGGPLVPGGGPTTTQGAPLPPGSAPGGGLPGGPGRRAPMPRGSSVKTAMTPEEAQHVIDELNQINSDDPHVIHQLEIIKTDMQRMMEQHPEYHNMKGGEGSIVWGKTASEDTIYPKIADTDWNDLSRRVQYDHKDMGEPGDARTDAVEGDMAGVTTNHWLNNYPKDEQIYLAAVDTAKRRGFTDGEIVTYLQNDPWYQTPQAQKVGAGPPTPEEILSYIEEVEKHYAQPTQDDDWLEGLGISPLESSVTKKSVVTDYRSALKFLQVMIGGAAGVLEPHPDDEAMMSHLHTDELAEEEVDKSINFIKQQNPTLANNIEGYLGGSGESREQAGELVTMISKELGDVGLGGAGVNVPEGIIEPDWTHSELSNDDRDFYGKTAIQAPYPPLGTAGPAQPEGIAPVQFGAQQPNPAEDKIKVEQLAQQYVTGQNMTWPEAYTRAALDLQGMPKSPMQDPSGTTAQPSGTTGVSPYSKVAHWQDVHGSPLQVDQMYKMTRPDIPVPDFVRVTWIEPENIRVRFANNDEETDVDTQDYSFEPLEDDSREITSSNDPLSWLNEGPSQEPLVDPSMAQKFAGRGFSHPEQREFIDEPGEARNMDRLNLRGTHYDAPKEIHAKNPGAIDPEQFLIG